MDGLGLGKDYAGNAVLHAKTPTLERLWNRADKKLLLGASGPDVGLPSGVTGNSEVGHLNLGAGTVVYQMVSTINDAIVDKSFFTSEVLIRMAKDVKKNNRTLHLMGLLTASGVHADVRHLFALLEFCHKNDIDPVLHIVTDGRDTPRFEAKFYLKKLREKMFAYGMKRIGSIGGRFYAMDRNNSWDRIKLAYDAMIGKSGLKERDPETALDHAYLRQEDDESLLPTMIVDASGIPVAPITKNDAVLFFNFREDRARQITKAFVMPNDKFTEFERPFVIEHFITMSGYEEGLPVEVMFHSNEDYTPISDAISQAGLKQFHIAETEKYAHVTYFFNGGREATTVGEEFHIIPSPKVMDYATVPEMSAYQVTETLLERIRKQQDDFFLLNLANPDMVGHSGKIMQTARACEVTDRCVYFLVKQFLAQGGRVMITADHGNAEQKIHPVSGEPDKNHTLNLVPFMYIENPDVFDDAKWTDNLNLKRLVYDANEMDKNGILSDIPATLLKLLDVPLPKSMTGQSLL
jgi:2,3-bisphosphoglycerate-independent phosphoglycerate mutase